MNHQPQHIHLQAICSPRELALQLLADIEEAKAVTQVLHDEENEKAARAETPNDPHP